MALSLSLRVHCLRQSTESRKRAVLNANEVYGVGTRLAEWIFSCYTQEKSKSKVSNPVARKVASQPDR